jgi:hypothetical protein
MTYEDRTAFATIIVGLFLGVFVMGLWAGLTMYRHDTFDCTNVCGGKHSIYNNNVCYCEAGE